MGEFDREHVLELLERFGDKDDAAVVAAARELRAHVLEAGLSWDEVVAPDGDFFEEDEELDEEEPDEEDADGEDLEVEDEEPPLKALDDVLPQDFDEDAKTIDRLLARKGLSTDTRAELSDLKADLAAGEFTAMDSRYVRALAKRLGA